MPRFARRSEMPVPAADVFAWHARPGAFERLAPPWQPVRLISHTGIRDGDRAVLALGVGPLSVRWVAEHRDYVEGRQFRDVQLSGPFAAWSHLHRMTDHDVDLRRSFLLDEVDYELPAAPVSEVLGGERARHELVRLFAYRQRTTWMDLHRHACYPSRGLTVAVTGASGLIGRALCAFLTTGGHRIVRLVRSRAEAAIPCDAPTRTAFWHPERGLIDAGALEGVDVVVHLAGEPVLGPWTRRRRARILDSRVRGTRLLAETLAALDAPPRVFLSASATGFYGDRGSARVTEAEPPGSGFLARVCQGWEAATAPAERAGIRVCHLRLGVVQTPAGGLLQVAHPAFLAGLGGIPGRAAAWMPWVALDDVLYAILHLMHQEDVRGPVNVVSPHAVPMRVWARSLGAVLDRPAWLRVPAPLLRAAGGEQARELLAGARVHPAALLNSGFEFAYGTLTEALSHVLGRALAVPS